MAQPLARRLRTARPRGLTSPDQVRTPRRKATPIPDLDPGTPEPRNPGRAAQQASGGTPTPRFTRQNSSCRNQAGNELPQFTGGSRLRRPAGGPGF
jgi:hypothetical protein